MCEDTEDASDIDEDFFNALALLHSPEDDSTEKLRKILDTFIERRYGFDKTLMARMPKKFLQNTKIRGKSIRKEKPEMSRKKGSAVEKSESLSFFANNSIPTESDWKYNKVLNTEFEDYSDKGDIPRISIPDEGSADGLLCKVCSGAKLGPLILLECQECQDVYHPLCHQPPVVDIDVYDPRIVWRCRKCVDTSSVNSAIGLEEDKTKRSRLANDQSKVNESSIKVDKCGKLNGNLSKDQTNVTDQILPDVCQITDCTVEDTLITKGGFHVNQKTIKATSMKSNQLRKRIGSKLSVTRSVAKG